MKTLHNATVSGARDNVKDIEISGKRDIFKLLCKASSKAEGWMKSTKLCLLTVALSMLMVVLAQTSPQAQDAFEKVAKQAPIPASHGISVVRIEDLRKSSNDGFQAGMKVTLGGIGVDVEKVKNIDCTLTSATDSSGKDLIKKEKGFFDKTEFKVNDNNDSFELDLHLKNPIRTATSIKLEGTVDVFIPSDDPAATIRIANVKKTAGSPIKSEALQALNASVVLMSPKDKTPRIGNSKKISEDDKAKAIAQEFASIFSVGGPNSITFEIVDPEGKIHKIEFFSAAGKQIESHGSSSTGDAQYKLVKTLDFDAPLPETAEMRIYIVTSKALKKIPFKITDFPLP